jgi:glyoxylase-like metal-dependent hydrolase (beta-lactamase superfamily II)
VSVRLHPIKVGEIRLDVIAARPPRRGPGKVLRTLLRSMFRRAQWYPVPVYLVEHPSAGPFLIDAGYDPSIEADPAHTLGRFFGTIAMQHRLDGPTVREAVAERGVDPTAISRVVMTHLHNDHASGAGQWPEATFVADAAERTAAMSDFGPYVSSHLETIERWQDVDFQGPDVEPFEDFSRTIDLLGDGSVRLVSSPGHSAGHQSVLLRLRERFVLVCGDAAMSTTELGDRVIDGVIVDQDSYLRSGDEARAFMRAHPDTLAIPSHDTELWERLEPVYE